MTVIKWMRKEVQIVAWFQRFMLQPVKLLKPMEAAREEAA